MNIYLLLNSNSFRAIIYENVQFMYLILMYAQAGYEPFFLC